MTRKPISIILNGAPESGKDSLKKEFFHLRPYSMPSMWIEHGSFAKPLKDILQIKFNLTNEEVQELDSNHVLKNTPQDRFGGKSWRDCCMYLSVDLKKEFGEDYFGKHMIKRIEQTFNTNTSFSRQFPSLIISDSGFDLEVVPIIDKFGADNVHVIKIIREGFDFKKDSRKYLDCEKLGITCHNLENIEEVQYLKDGCSMIIDILTKE